MMEEDTEEAAQHSPLIDISPLVDVISAGLDQFGIRGVYIELFQTPKLIDVLQTVAVERSLDNFKTQIVSERRSQPYLRYDGFPNQRKSRKRVGKCRHCASDVACSGCKWWLDHYAGAITAEKLLQDGFLYLDEGKERVNSTSAFMKELQRIERLEISDIMVFHAQHGFTWHYLAKKMPELRSYPMELAENFCGELLHKKGEFIQHVQNENAAMVLDTASIT